MLRRTILKLFGTYQRGMAARLGVECGKADVKVVSGDRYREIGVLEVSRVLIAKKVESKFRD